MTEKQSFDTIDNYGTGKAKPDEQFTKDWVNKQSNIPSTDADKKPDQEEVEIYFQLPCGEVPGREKHFFALDTNVFQQNNTAVFASGDLINEPQDFGKYLTQHFPEAKKLVVGFVLKEPLNDATVNAQLLYCLCALLSVVEKCSFLIQGEYDDGEGLTDGELTEELMGRLRSLAWERSMTMKLKFADE